VVCRHEAADNALDGECLLKQKLGLGLGPGVTVVPGGISSNTALGARSRPAATSSSMRVTRPGKIVGGYVSTNHTKMELVSMQ